MKDFTHQKYEELLLTIISLGFPIFGVANWLEVPTPKKGAMIRHDVDRRPENALAMAKLEHDLGIKTTYYFRVVGSAYSSTIILSIADLGHEIGYHYEDLALAKGDLKKAVESFKKHIEKLRKLTPIKTVAMHGSPLSAEHNLDIWSNVSLSDIGILGDAFLSVDYREIKYFTDTGRGWNRSKVNLRDRPPGVIECDLEGHGTVDLIRYLRTNRVEKLAFCIHPERWNANPIDWSLQLIIDSACNMIKKIVKSTYPDYIYRR